MSLISNLLSRHKAVWNPDMYHGWGKKEGYFEGWYYKIVSKDEQHAFAIIPGISKGMDGRHHSFIQLLDGKNLATAYLDFGIDAFVPDRDDFKVAIGPNTFSKYGFSLDSELISGQVAFSQHVPWPKHLGAPGIMGWYSFVPFMQCYHGIVSMHHELSGWLRYRGLEINFDGGVGYIEKDWGVSFPKCWIWMQSNHFDHTDEPISCCASVAHIPWLGKYFVGFIVGILYKGEVIRFATYLGSKMSARIDGDLVYLSFKSRKYLLEIKAIKKGGGELISPIEGLMTGKINESLQSIMELKLYEKGTLLYTGTGRNTGLEIGGDVSILLDQ